jgi:dephospho-CoA kinase
VTAPALVRLFRAMRRDGLSLRDAWIRINAQKDVRPQLNDGGVDTYIVRNRGSMRSLQRRVERIAADLRG